MGSSKRSKTAPALGKSAKSQSVKRANTSPPLFNTGRNKGKLPRGGFVEREKSFAIRIQEARGLIKECNSILKRNIVSNCSSSYCKKVSNSLYRKANELREWMPGDSLDTFHVSEEELKYFHQVVEQLEEIAKKIDARHFIPPPMQTGRKSLR